MNLWNEKVGVRGSELRNGKHPKKISEGEYESENSNKKHL
jgi:hypothetical protein